MYGENSIEKYSIFARKFYLNSIKIGLSSMFFIVEIEKRNLWNFLANMLGLSISGFYMNKLWTN